MIRKPEPFFFEGGKQGVILLHAFASNSNDMRMLGRALQRAGYSVYAPILSGHATDNPKDLIYQGSPAKWWQDTQNAIEFMLQRNFESLAIFGLSLGGMFATKALENYPQLTAGGTFSSPVVRVGKSNVPVYFPKMVETQYEKLGVSEAVKVEGVEWLQAHLPQLLDEIEQFAESVAADLDKITVPFFIGQGDADEMIDPDNGTALQERLAKLGKHVELHVYPGASHVLTVNSAHQALEEDVTKFLDKYI